MLEERVVTLSREVERLWDEYRNTTRGSNEHMLASGAVNQARVKGREAVRDLREHTNYHRCT